jgi:hypothetical protein
MGDTASSDFPTTPGAFDTTFNDGTYYFPSDAFVVKLAVGGGPATYSISGYVTDSSNNPISGVTVSTQGSASAITSASGHYSIGSLGADTYILTPFKSGYTFSPPSRTVSVPPNATGQDFTARPTTGLIYIGPLYLWGDNAVLVDEADHRITNGDHVHLRLPFRNTSSQPISNATVEVVGKPESGGAFGVTIYNGINWGSAQTLSLNPATLSPGATGYADFWIYVRNNDPTVRTSLINSTWLRVSTPVGQWVVQISLFPIWFDISDNDPLKVSDCLHNPGNYGIETYAQYAVAAKTRRMPPTNAGDPDVPSQAVRNLVNLLRDEFYYVDTGEERRPDTTLLARRYQNMGRCLHYADLTTGLMRSLNLPTRYITGMFYDPNWSKKSITDALVGHAWTEVYLPDDGGWRQADSTAKVALAEWVYESPASGKIVKMAAADRFPLSSACFIWAPQCRCVQSCYKPPIDCADCLFWNIVSPTPEDTSCVENVKSRYHNVSPMAVTETSEEGQLVVRSQAGVFVTRTVPFSLTAGLINSTTATLGNITATVSISESLDSKVVLFDVEPPYQTVSNIYPGGVVSVTWIVTPLVTGIGLPLRVVAFSGDLVGFDEHPVVVNEPGTLPDLSLSEGCGPGTVGPGQPLTLSVSVRGEYLQPITDSATIVTATVYSTPTLAFSTTINLAYCKSCGHFEQVVNLPTDAPFGNYEIGLAASHPGYDPAQIKTTLFVTPPLTMTLSITSFTLSANEPLTLTALIYDRGITVTGAGVFAQVTAPNGVVTMPLEYDGNAYIQVFHPVDLEPNLGTAVSSGLWKIQVMADYYGSTVWGSITTVVLYKVYLPLVLRR